MTRATETAPRRGYCSAGRGASGARGNASFGRLVQYFCGRVFFAGGASQEL